MEKIEKPKDIKTKEHPHHEPYLSNCFIVSVDGSEGSHNAFELVVNDLHKKGLDKIIIVHIFSEKDEELGDQYHNKTIFNKYSEELKSKLHEDDYEIIFEERKQNENVFEQINEIAVAKNASVMVLGYRGKDTSKKPDELSQALTYLVHKPTLPILIVKGKIQRNLRGNNSFNWLCCLESPDSKCFKAVSSMCRFVDNKNDTFTGITVRNSTNKIENDELTRKKFDKTMNKFEIKKHTFSIIEKNENENVNSCISKFIKENEKNPDLSFDFMVCGYNPAKYMKNKDVVNTTVDLIKTVDCNIFFDH